MKYIYIFLLLIISNIAFADNNEPDKDRVLTDANIFGHVIDKRTHEHIPFITISLKNTGIGTACDGTGHYMLKNLPLGDHILVAKGMGYKTLEKKVKSENGKTIEVNFELEEDVVLLDAVVVSANKNETSRKEAPVVVNVISKKLFETTNAVCLSQSLDFQPGLRVETNCQNCGFQQVRINGLDGPYTQMLLDSKPMFSALSSVYGIEQIPVEMIDRVEVVRGGGSALFGANAIAGTINIITKEPLHNNFSIAHNLTAIGGKAYDNTTNANASIVDEYGKMGIYLYGSNRARQHYDDNGDGFSEIGELSNTSFGFRNFIKPSQQLKITLEYHNIREFRRGGNKFKLQPHETDITEQLNHDIHGGSADIKYFSKDYAHMVNAYASLQNTSRKSYYGSQQDMDAYGRTHDLTAIAGVQYSYKMNHFLFMPATFTSGSEYSKNILHDEMPGYHRNLEQTVHSAGVYLQNEWSNKKLSFLIGGRLDRNWLLDNPVFTPRINFRYNLTSDINFRASYSEGFRAPQAFDEDLHVAAVGGEAYIINLGKNLKSERSRSYTASIDTYKKFGDVQTNLLIEGFYTHLKDVFYLEPMGRDEDNNQIVERRNGKGATIKGVNVEAKLVPAYWFQLQIGGTYQKSRYEEAVAWSEEDENAKIKNLTKTPDLYGYTTLSIKPTKLFEIAVSGTYTGKMDVPHLAGYIEHDVMERSSDFWNMNLKMSYDFELFQKTTLQVKAGIQNIFDAYQNDFDKEEFRDATYMYGPGIPRSYFVGLKLNI